MISLLLTAVLSSPASDPPADQGWPNWRGPRHDGSADASGLPLDFSKDEHVQWVVDLPGPSAGTPVILEDKVFVTSVDTENQTLLAMCFDRATGEERWRDVAGSGYQPGEKAGHALGMHPRSNYASPSPVTDGARVVFFYGNGDLVCYDLDGERIWSRNLQQDLGDFCFQWTFSSSPTLWEDRLFLQILQRDEPVRGIGGAAAPSYLLCIDPDTGDTVYKHDRPSTAQKESLESYATPIPYVGEDGRKELIVVGGDVITGHDPATGEELWRWGTWNEGHRQQWWRLVPTAVVGDGVALVCAPKRAPVYAVELGGEGVLEDSALRWQSDARWQQKLAAAATGEREPNPVTSDVPTPLYYQGKFFVLSDVRGALSCVDPASGQVDWSIALPEEPKWRASPTGADGKIWCMNHAGEVLVVDPADGSILSRVMMGEEGDDQTRSSIVALGNRLFIRTHSKLFCIGS